MLTNDEQRWNQYKSYRNKVQIISEKEKYFIDVLDENKHNSQQLWKNIKKMLPREVVSNSELIATNKFNEYYEIKAKILKNKFKLCDKQNKQLQ